MTTPARPTLTLSTSAVPRARRITQARGVGGNPRHEAAEARLREALRALDAEGAPA